VDAAKGEGFKRQEMRKVARKVWGKSSISRKETFQFLGATDEKKFGNPDTNRGYRNWFLAVGGA